MAERRTDPTVYYIPDNYIGEARIFQGQLKLRSVLEGGVLGAAGVFISFLLPIHGMQSRIVAGIIAAAPGFILGLAGYNGDNISTAADYIREWYKNREMKIYNTNPRILEESPATELVNAERASDRIVEIWSDLQKKRIEKRENTRYVEGETFEFRHDHFIDDYAVPPMTDEEFEEYQRKMGEQKKMDKDGLRIVSRLNLDDLEDISALDGEQDYSIENAGNTDSVTKYKET